MNLPDSKPQDFRPPDSSFYLMVESSPNAVLLVNREGRIGYANRQSELLFGYASAELIGQSIEMLMPEHFRKNHAVYLNRFMQKPTLRPMGAGRVLSGLRKDGSEFPTEIGLNSIELTDGMWVLVTMVDVTEREQAGDRFRQVVHSSPNAIVLVNRCGKIVLVNQQTCALFGYEEKEMLGQPLDILLPERFRSQHAKFKSSFFADPQTRFMGVGRDLVGLHKEGKEIPIEIGLNPMQTSGELMVLASIVDITKRHKQEELRAEKEAAEAANKAKSEQLAIASHDLKNPLAAITGLSEILLQMKKATPSASTQDIEFLQNIYDASRHMSEMVKGILANEDWGQQGFALNKENVDLSALCNDLVRFNEPVAQRKDIHLLSNIAPDIALCGDKTRLYEAFDNYINNAIKYSPSGKTVTVTLTRLPDKGQIEFGVRDQGPGLTDDDKTQIFGKYKKLSAKPTGDEFSTGLGLSIVKTFVELHNGSVGCDSTYGQGAYFWARLPTVE
ncbi:MAG: PAS domain-containing sensor histidine kinase [Xanthomonadaceae bacterium]|jgi:PAS domain S-box-containing protein|nr:PAS domain-containing sensor histidine kinase [Xanthomonadaceae bacterium]